MEIVQQQHTIIELLQNNGYTTVIDLYTTINTIVNSKSKVVYFKIRVFQDTHAL